MLSRLGKFSAAIVIAGGATLLRIEPASASTLLENCNAEQLSYACSAAATYWYENGGTYYCGQYNGVCTTDGSYVYFGVDFYDNGSQPCPTTQPC